MNEEKKLNVGLFIDTFFPMVDGVIMVVDNLARRLCTFCNVTVFTLKPRGYKKFKKELPYKVVQCSKLFVPFLDYDLPTPKIDNNFITELENSQLDIVHIHSPFSIGRIGLDYAKEHHIPAIATLHSQYKRDFYRVTKSHMITNMLVSGVVRTFDRCDEFYAVNKNLAKIFFCDYGVSHMPSVLRNGTDMLPVDDKEAAIERVNKAFDLDPQMPLYLFVGRINKLKNIHFILDALTFIKDKPFKMIFVGDGQDLAEFKQKVADCDMTQKIIFAGKITDREFLKAIYHRAKLFLFPSMYDASSLVQIEAASQGTPTVFLKGAATAGTVTDNVNGFLSDPTPEAFARKIEEISADEELYNKVSQGAVRDLYVTWDQCVNENFSKYKENIERYKLIHSDN